MIRTRVTRQKAKQEHQDYEIQIHVIRDYVNENNEVKILKTELMDTISFRI